jgi:cytochrome c553
MSLIKVTAVDRYFSLCVRERANWTCERCGLDLRYDPGRLHCSHVFSRRWASVRHEPTNALALCIGCHRTMGENPIDHTELYLLVNGRERYEILKELKERIVRKRDRPDKLMAAHYRGELQRMQAARLGGDDGRIEFAGWL